MRLNLLITVIQIIGVICLVVGESISSEDLAGPRIVGGRVCEIEEIPFIIAILLLTSYTFARCGGSLITYEWVLSAAHCILDKSLRNNRIFASAGCKYPLRSSLFAQSTSSEYIQRRLIVHAVKHEKYNRKDNKDLRYDISIMRVEKPFDPHPNIKLAALPTKGFYDGINCTTGVTAGWGDTLAKLATVRGPKVKRKDDVILNVDMNNPLKCVELPIVSLEKCKETFPPSMYGIDDTVICTLLPEGGKDSCTGDSGGPLICHGVVIGIVKGSFGCARSGVAAGYVKVEAYLDWIAEAMKNRGENRAEDRNDSGKNKDVALNYNKSYLVSIVFNMIIVALLNK